MIFIQAMFLFHVQGHYINKYILHASVACVLQSLEAALKKALKSHYEDICLGLLMTPAHFDAHLFRKATHVNITQCANFIIYFSLGCTPSERIPFSRVWAQMSISWWRFWPPDQTRRFKKLKGSSKKVGPDSVQFFLCLFIRACSS